MGNENKMIAQALIKNGTINEVQLDKALKRRRNTNESLEASLVNLGFVTREEVAMFTAETCGLKYIDLDILDVQPEAVKCIPCNLCRRYNIVPLKIEQGVICYACDTPLNLQVLGNLKRLTGMQLRGYLSTQDRIKGVLGELYQPGTSAIDLSEEAAVIKLVNGLIEKAIRERASDIHFESGKNSLRIRFRVDGLLREVETHPSDIGPPVVSRIKVMSNLNIAEKRSPQDGAFSFNNGNESVDIRVSVLPNIYGEKVVLRLLSSENRWISFESLGMEKDTIELFTGLLKRPHGMILLASPTGSGKSTTLYSALMAIKSEEVNITTVEDPVEYKVEGITQVQVDQAMKVTFPTALRSILRQDPDIIMIGEIRDRATAEIALQSSLTGHLVLATIHTNDATGALTRLVDMGCEPFLVSSTVCGIMAQRLVRNICPHCKAPFKPTIDELNRFGLSETSEDLKWFRGGGCRHCHNTGYRGRTAIFELCKVNRDIQLEVVKKSSAEKIKDVAVASGMLTLFDDGLRKVNKGISTPEEVMRVTLLE